MNELTNKNKEFMEKRNKEIKELLGVPDSAFPSYPFSTGLSRREYFAGLAMQGLLAGGYSSSHLTAVQAVNCADSLLAELNKMPDGKE